MATLVRAVVFYFIRKTVIPSLYLSVHIEGDLRTTTLLLYQRQQLALLSLI